MKKALKWIGINLGVLLALIILLDLGSLLINEVRFHRAHYLFTHGDPRAGLPGYDRYNWAKQHFEEFNQVTATYRSYVGWRGKPFNGNTIQVDGSGIRHTEQSLLISDSSITVAFLGGSAMWGTGSDDAHTIPSLFSQQGQGSYRALNWGESGYTAYQGYQFLQLQLMQGERPQLVIAYDGANNSCSRKAYWSHIREGQIQERMEGADAFQVGPRPHEHYLAPTRSILEGIRRKVAPQQATSGIACTAETDSLAAIELLESWLATYRLLSLYEIEFICALQPVAFYGSPNLEHIDLSADPFREGYHFYSNVLAYLKLDRYRPLQDRFLNLTMAFDGVENLYIDYCHVTPDGNQRIARNLVDFTNARTHGIPD